MACTVLRLALPGLSGIAAGVVFALLHVPTASAQGACSAGRMSAASDMLRMAARSPFYQLAKERLGPATGCKASKDEDGEMLVLSFAHDSTLTFSSSPSIEFTSQALVLGDGGRPMTRAGALMTLKRTELDATGPGGCGIPKASWRVAASSPNSQIEVSGTICNCKATLQTKQGAVVQLGFSTAC